MEFETLKVTVDGELGRLTLSRPERLNALGATTLLELAQAARYFDQQPEVRVVIVSGEGRAFSAGADLRDSPSGDAHDLERSWAYRREAAQRGLRMANAVEQMRAVTIAQVHGYAVGGGLVLMAACDLRVAAEDAVFFIPEVELGIPLAWGGIPRLVREIGPALTKELVMTCRHFTPAEAKAAGFVNRVVPQAELAAATQELADRLLAMPAAPVIMTKDHVNAVSQAIGPGLTAFADGDVLMGTLGDPSSVEARERYMKKTFRE